MHKTIDGASSPLRIFIADMTSELTPTEPIFAPHEVTLVMASPEQQLVTRRNTFPFWGKPKGYTFEGYLEMDAYCEREKWGKHGAHVIWVLVPKDDSKTTTRILSQVETFRRAALVRPPSSPPGEAAEVQDVIGYGIESVFTVEARRGRGYATYMMRMLHYLLASPATLPPFPASLGSLPPRAPPDVPLQDGVFSVLYSDIGPSFYAAAGVQDDGGQRSGWNVSDRTSWSWEIEEREAAERHGMRVEWLDREGVMSAEDEMDRVVRAGFEQDKVAQFEANDEAATGDEKERSKKHFKATIAFLPSGGTLSIHPLRYTLPLPSHTTLPTFGARLSSARPDGDDAQPLSRASPTFFYTYSSERKPDKTLLITFISGEDVPWEAVERAARKERCRIVEIWGDRKGKDWPTGKKEIRTSHLPSVAFYDHRGDVNYGDVEFAFNEHYAWC